MGKRRNTINISSSHTHFNFSWAGILSTHLKISFTVAIITSTNFYDICISINTHILPFSIKEDYT
jgi:hypothetical protein